MCEMDVNVCQHMFKMTSKLGPKHFKTRFENLSISKDPKEYNSVSEAHSYYGHISYFHSCDFGYALSCFPEGSTRRPQI